MKAVERSWRDFPLPRRRAAWVAVLAVAGVAACDRDIGVEPGVRGIAPVFATVSTAGLAPVKLNVTNVSGEGNELCRSIIAEYNVVIPGGLVLTTQELSAMVGVKVQSGGQNPQTHDGLRVTLTEEERFLSWERISGTSEMLFVLTKPGNQSFVYNYRSTPGVVETQDTNLSGEQQSISHWVICYLPPPATPQAKISIEQDGTNRVGSPHTVTGSVLVAPDVGQPFAPAADGTTINFAIASGPGSLSAPSCTTSGGTGSCSVTLNSAVTGVTVVNASSTLTVGSTTFNLLTDGNSGNSGPLTKTWVDAKISIEPGAATNPVNEAHTFTVTLWKDVGDGNGFVAAAGETVTALQSGSLAPATLGGTCTSGGTTDASGQCTFTANSSTPGTLTLTAVTTLSVGGSNITLTTDATGNNSGPASKTWVDARISIGADATNRVGENHTFTVLVEGNSGSGFAPLSGQLVTATKTGIGSFVNDSCTTGSDGRCTIEVASNATGQMVVTASAAVSSNGATVTVSTNGSGDNSGPATKRWVNAKIAIAPATATNPVNEQHTFTVTVWKDLGDGNGFVAAAGESVTAAQSGSLAPVTLGGTCASGTTSASGQCTFTANSSTPGTLTLTASSTVTISGVAMTVTTNGAAGNSAPASKTWVAVRIAIGADGTNRVGQNHTFTVLVQQNSGSGFGPVSGQLVTASKSGVGSFINDNCTTASDGTCGIEVASGVTGQMVVTAFATVNIGSGGLSVSTNGSGDNSGPATKTWVDAKIAITPSTATNPVNVPHTFTATVWKNVGDGNGFVAAPGETVTVAQSGSLAPAVLGGTCTTATTDGAGQCTFTANSTVPGTLTLTASSTLAIGGATITLTTDAIGNNSGPATKTWVSEYQGCTLTQGYWKTHADVRNAKMYNRTWVLVGGPGAPFFSSGKSYLQALNTSAGSNVYYILAQQYIATKLNRLSGASAPPAVMDAFEDATDLFESTTPAQAAALKGTARNAWVTLATILDRYNNGLIGPGHCSG